MSNFTKNVVLLVVLVLFAIASANAGHTKKQKLIQPERKNKIKTYVGYGATGYKLSRTTGGLLKVSDTYGGILGVGFERKIDDQFSAEAIGFSNESIVLRVGFSF